MWNRWGLGPVYAYETLLNARRWQVYAGRSLFVLTLLIGMTIVWISQDRLSYTIPTGQPPSFAQLAKLGEWFFYTMAGVQVSLVLLAAPAAAAGSICMDRARGTLMHMMMTDLSDVEIVLGKLGARLAPIIGIIACGVPVAALSALLGGVEFGAIASTFVVSLSLAMLCCTLAIAISVWARKAHEVLMAVYVFEGMWLLALPIWWSWGGSGILITPPEWFQKANPYVLVLAPFNQPGFAGTFDYAVFAAIVLLLSAALLVLSVVKLRRVIIKQSGRPAKKVRRLPDRNRFLPSWLGPTLDGNPVLWREWHRNHPSRLAWWIWSAMLAITWLLAAWGTYELLADSKGDVSGGLALGLWFQLVIGLLILSATAPTLLAEERVCGSLDVLLATTISTRSIIVGKWWGAYSKVFVLAILPLYTATFLAGTTPDIPNYTVDRVGLPIFPLTIWDRILVVTCCLADFLMSCALIVSLGLLIATWIRRLGQAVTLSVIAYFVTGIGWLFLVEFVFSQINSSQSLDWQHQNRWLETCAMSFSPIFGTITPLLPLEQFPFHGRAPFWITIGFVIVFKAAVAGLLFWLTIRTFDRCLGRVTESRRSEASHLPSTAGDSHAQACDSSQPIAIRRWPRRTTPLDSIREVAAQPTPDHRR
jgi:ABC-type transport system involved in multi-copper enzyme maturation permease subunit